MIRGVLAKLTAYKEVPCCPFRISQFITESLLPLAV